MGLNSMHHGSQTVGDMSFARASPFMRMVGNKLGASTGVNESELDDIFFKSMNEHN